MPFTTVAACEDKMVATGRRRLYLMRHGHVDYFAQDVSDFRQVPLTEVGKVQAARSGDALKTVTFDQVFTSGLPRTRQTAQIVLAQNEAATPGSLDLPDFEELRGGEVIAETREELAAWLAFSFDDAAQAGATFLPGGEAFADAAVRVVSGLDRLICDHRWKTALLVAHDGVNRILLSHLCGAGLNALGQFEQDLACVNVLDFDVVPAAGGRVEIARCVIKAVNVTSYDPIKSSLPRTSLEHMFDIDFGGARPPKD